MIYLQTTNLSFAYETTPVLESVSFAVERGDFFAVTGPNGGGKSTLIKLCMGVLTPPPNSIKKADEIIDSIAYMPQKSYIATPDFPLTVEEVVLSGVMGHKRFFSRVGKGEKEQAEEALKLLKISDLKDKRAGALSGGQQQRVLLARAFVSKPSLIILDEPTGALDPLTRDCFFETLQEMHNYHDTTILMISHDSETVGKYANKILHLNKKVLYCGSYSNFPGYEDHHYFYHKSEPDCHGCAELLESDHNV